MGRFSKLFGGRERETGGAQPEPEEDPAPDAVVVLRRGMNLPDRAYVEQVIALLFVGGLPEPVARVGLSQPSWFKTEEVADHIAESVVAAFAVKLELGEVSSRRRVLRGPDGCECMLIELRRS